MGLLSGSKDMSQKEKQVSPKTTSTGNAVSLVNSLMKSWKISSNTSPQMMASGGDRSNSGNFDAIVRQQGSAIRSSSSYSPSRHVTPSNAKTSTDSPRPILYSNHRGSYNQENGNKKNNSYFKDLDEDWSAVIDDYNMPIPTIVNGDISRSNSDSFAAPGTARPYEGIHELSRKQTDSSINSNISLYTHGASTSAVNSNQAFTYPQLPKLQKSLSSDLKSQIEIENERDAQELNSIMQRIAKFDTIINDKRVVNQQELRQLSWNGIPTVHRPKVWKLLIGYLPANTKRQDSLCQRKRQEYIDGIEHIFSEEHSRDIPTWHQIEIDIPRTNPHIPLYQFKSIQASLQRILYLWAIRHPASGYVQGINDIVTPFYQTFLTEYLLQSQIDYVETLDPETYTTSDQIKEVEADTFWCLSKLLEQITDNYIHGQPGILKQVKNLGQLVKRIDIDLYNHFTNEHVEFMQFAFRWMNCLLMREFQMSTVIRMWDTYLAETSLETTSGASATVSTQSATYIASDTDPRTPIQGNPPTFETPTNEYHSPLTLSHAVSASGMTNENNNRLRYSSLNEFHVFICAAFLIKWSDKLLDMDFQEIITFLQNPPTSEWNETDIEMLLSEAYIWQSLYKDATSHWL